MSCPPLPKIASLALVCLVAHFTGLSVCSLPAQTADGFTVQERAGLALVKPQAWSKPQEATVFEFIAYTDRTVQGTPGAGYFEFRTKQTDKRQVPAGRVVKLIVYPQAGNFPDIMSAEDRGKIIAAVDDLKASVQQFPSTRTYVEPSIKELNAEVARYDGGEFKIKGEWQPKESYYTKQISSLGSQLRQEINQAKPPSSFDLQADPRFVGLQQLAGSSASAGKLAGELLALHDKLVRGEQREALLNQLNGNTITLTEAMGAVGRLQSLQPDEDPRCTLFLKKWMTSLAETQKLNEAAQPLAAAVEAELQGVAVGTVPVLSDDLGGRIGKLGDQVRAFQAAQPPTVLLLTARPAISLVTVVEGLKKLPALIGQKQFPQAKDLLDGLTGKASEVGPQAMRVVSELQQAASARIEQFTKLRQEADLLLQSGKQQEALAKYQAAAEVLADPAVSEQIASLQKSVSPAP